MIEKIIKGTLIGFGCVLILLGTSMIIRSSEAQRVENNFNNNAIEVQAYVEEVKQKRDYYEGTNHNKTELYYETYVTYTVNNKTYENIKIVDVGNDKYTKDVGSYITLYCTEDNPQYIKTEKDHEDVDLFMIGLGWGTIACGLVLIISIVLAGVIDNYKKKKAVEEINSWKEGS